MQRPIWSNTYPGPAPGTISLVHPERLFKYLDGVALRDLGTRGDRVGTAAGERVPFRFRFRSSVGSVSPAMSGPGS
jgi:hypothetical protein